MGGETEDLILLLGNLEYFDCWWVGGFGVDNKVLFRASCFLGFIQGWGQRVSPRFLLLISDVYQCTYICM